MDYEVEIFEHKHGNIFQYDEINGADNPEYLVQKIIAEKTEKSKLTLEHRNNYLIDSSETNSFKEEENIITDNIKTGFVDIKQFNHEFSSKSKHHSESRSVLISNAHLQKLSTSKKGLIKEEISGTDRQYNITSNCSLKKNMNGNLKKENSFMCPFCKYTSSQSHHMKSHISTIHLKDRPFSCYHCFYKTTRKCYLKEHILSMHLQIKPYSCKICTFKTAKKGNLTSHISVVHEMKPKFLSNKKSYSCPNCSYIDYKKSNVSRHVSSVHHDLRPYSCLYCSHRSKRMTHLRLHMVNKHGKVTPNIVVTL